MPALPTRPSLRQLRNQAKDLHKALVAGDADAAARVRRHLPGLDRGEKSPDAVGLQEVQHALAREYGFRTWDELLKSVDLDFASLALLSDVDLQALLRQVDQKALVLALAASSSPADEEIRQRLLGQMSVRVRGFLVDEIGLLGTRPEGEVAEVRRRILAQARQLGEAGHLAWPPGSKAGPNAPLPPPEWPPELDLVRRPLEELSIDEVRTLCRGLCKRARESGILSLEGVAAEAVSPRVQEAARLAADGAEPDLLADILHTRRKALVHHLDTRMKMIIEGVMSIDAGDNPDIVVYKLNCVYSPYKPEYRERWSAVEQIRERLAEKAASGMGPDERARYLVESAAKHFRACVDETPVSAMDPDELTMFIADAADYARHVGAAYLSGVADLVDEELLATGLRLAAEQADGSAIMETLVSRAAEIVREGDLRLRLVADAMAGIQQAKDLAGLEEVLDQTQARMEAEGRS
ncbi:MAG: FliG C-terminal domain-containing protein [Gemmatimonadota bacterium]